MRRRSPRSQTPSFARVRSLERSSNRASCALRVIAWRGRKPPFRPCSSPARNSARYPGERLLPEAHSSHRQQGAAIGCSMAHPGRLPGRWWEGVPPSESRHRGFGSKNFAPEAGTNSLGRMSRYSSASRKPSALPVWPNCGSSRPLTRCSKVRPPWWSRTFSSLGRPSRASLIDSMCQMFPSSSTRRAPSRALFRSPHYQRWLSSIGRNRASHGPRVFILR